MLNHFFPLLFPKDFESLKILDIRLWEGGVKNTVKRYLKSEKVRENNFFLRGDFRQFSNKTIHIWDHFFPLLFPKDSESLKKLDIRLWEVGAKRPSKGTSKVKKVREKNYFLRCNFRQFSNKNVHIWDHLFPLLFPKDSEVGAKRLLNGTSKVNRHTHGQTNTQTDGNFDL